LTATHARVQLADSATNRTKKKRRGAHAY